MDYMEEEELDPTWVCCLLEDVPDTCCDAFSLDSAVPWPFPTAHPSVRPTSLSKSSKESCGTLDDLDECCRKRVRGASSCESSSRASREKVRRDRVNERFLELSGVLEPGKTPKLDKAAILTDAIQMVKMLQQETTTLKSQNVELKQKTTELKAEKKELRSEKHRLRTEKDRIEQRLKTLTVPHGSLKPRPPVSLAPYVISCPPVAAKTMHFYNYPSVPLWHFAPHASVDTSQDHVLHPPVA